ncbi:hypothetical protein Dimus_017711 [Dionaea muscipula]
MQLNHFFARQILRSFHLSDPYPILPPMNPSDFPSSGDPQPSPPGKRGIRLKGPRPTPLKVSKDSCKIKKQSLPAASQPPRRSHAKTRAPAAATAAADTHKPVIIYDVSPKVITTDAGSFKALVQRLTGLPPSDTGASTSSSSSMADAADEVVADDPISPAARFALTEKTSPTERSKERERNSNAEVGGELVGLVGGVDLGQMPGILSPMPAHLPAVSPGLFSPAVDMQALFGVHDSLSPLMFGHSFPLGSPGVLPPSTVPGLSPTLSPTLDFSNFFDGKF